MSNIKYRMSNSFIKPKFFYCMRIMIGAKRLVNKLSEKRKSLLQLSKIKCQIYSSKVVRFYSCFLTIGFSPSVKVLLASKLVNTLST